MGGGKPAAVATRPAPGRKTLLITTAAIGLLCLAWWWQAGSRGNLPAADATASAQPGLAQTGSDSGGGAATIIDEPTVSPESTALAAGAGEGPGYEGEDDPLASPFAPPGPTTASVAMPRSDRANPFTQAAPAVTRTAPASTTARPTRSGEGARGSRGSEPNLMATLLGNIKAADAEPVSGLDTLIRKMESDEATVGAGKRSASADIQPTRSQQIQSNLRECPPANTAKGLKCRQDICAVYAGRDPACPAD
ncbi:hypothetical protein [Novilysobacter antarcticus]|uniref:hypothetical protein n=1 Tax=Novilysobacter antarcticus TaxID=2862543 RepID=UPI001C99E5A5|nr:hypothetical protein [Lysobacter antarcticus]